VPLDPNRPREQIIQNPRSPSTRAPRKFSTEFFIFQEAKVKKQFVCANKITHLRRMPPPLRSRFPSNQIRKKKAGVSFARRGWFSPPSTPSPWQPRAKTRRLLGTKSATEWKLFVLSPNGVGRKTHATISANLRGVKRPGRVAAADYFVREEKKRKCGGRADKGSRLPPKKQPSRHDFGERKHPADKRDCSQMGDHMDKLKTRNACKSKKLLNWSCFTSFNHKQCPASKCVTAGFILSTK
jgi:hypothetical protein